MTLRQGGLFKTFKMASSRRRSFIVGLSWKKMKNQNAEEENPKIKEKSSKSNLKLVSMKPLQEHNTHETTDQQQQQPSAPASSYLHNLDPRDQVLKRVNSVRDAFGTLRQKLKVSTRRRKRLDNQSPYGMVTPSSVAKRRRSARFTDESMKMYSPFCIDSPSKTPKMGVRSKRRFNFSSPGQLNKDVDVVAEGISTLGKLADNLDKAIGQQDSKPGVSDYGVRRSPRLQAQTPTQELNLPKTPSRERRMIRTNPTAKPTIFV